MLDVLGLRACLQPGFPWMPEELQMKAEDLLQQMPSRAAIPQIWTSVAWLDCFKARVSKRACFEFTFIMG